MFYLSLQTIISMLLKKKKKGTMLQENAREPYRCDTLPCVLFLVVYSCLLFWDLARFLCSFPLTCSYLSYFYNAFQAGFFFTSQRKLKECWPVQKPPASLGNNRILGLKTTLEIQGHGWLSSYLMNQSCRGIGDQALVDFEHRFHEIVSCLAETEGI